MSTVAPRPPAPPVPPALLDSERYIDDHIRRTRRALKLTDLAAGVITLAVGLLAFLLAAALIDHWIVPGGLSPGARMTLFGALVAGVAWYGWRQFAPLLQSINPVYAAHAIEKSAPSLKNSLLNLLLFRGHRQGMSARVYHALEQQAAQRLSTASTDGAIDRAALLRLGYALVAVIAACALYGVLSPKNLATSAARILAPLADIAAPSRVKILNIEPGDASVARGERVAISAEIRGAAADEPVRLRYSTADEQVIDETVVMTTPTVDAGGRFSAELPRASAAGRAAGVMQDIEYWIEAGDARSRRFRLSVFQRPTIVVQRLRYEYPAYTGEPSKTVDNVGDIRALEGTRVTVEALANQPIKSAHVDFDGDGTSDLAMRVDGDRAYATFEMGLRPDRRTPLHASYVLRFTTTAGRTNSDPAQYRIEVTPDYAPEVRIMAPEDPELSVRRDQTVLINVEARDPDYAVQRVRLVGRAGERDVELGELLSRDHPGRFSGTKPFVPGDVQLVAGDVLEYWAEAVDNRRPEANVTVSERRRLRIVDPDAAGNPERDRGPGGGELPQAEGGEGGDAGQPGEAGEGEDQQPGEGSAEGESGGEEGQPGAGAPGGGEGGEQSEQSESGEGQPSASGGESGENSGAESAAGAEGGTAGADGDESTQPSEGSGGGDQREPSGEDGADAEAGAGGAEGGAPSERVSTAGDDDSTAFDRIRERFAEQDAASRAEDAGGEGAEEAGEGADAADEQSAADAQPGAEGETQGEPAGERRDPAGAEAPSDGDAGEGEPREGDAPSEGESGEQPAGQPGEMGSADERPSDQQGTSETPAGADGANNPSNGGAPAGDDEGGEPGAPEASNKDPGEDSDAADEGESGAEGDAATADSKGDQESDASGDTGGDRSGAGQRGAGQQADNPGEGEAGSHEDAETGAGASSEPGAGETGTGPGEEQTAEGETGESSGDQPGAGSQSRETSGEGETGGQPEGDPAGGEQPGGDPAAGEQPAGPGEESGGEQPTGAGADGQPAGESGEPSASGEQPSASPSGDSPSSEDAAGEPSDPEEAPEGGDSSGGASSTPPTSGGNGQGGVDGTSPGGEPGGDDANLQFAREQTDLMLERLDDQLANQQVDAELLRRLGWSEDELQQFVARWREFQARAAADDSGEGQQELDAALRSLGLRPTGSLGIRPGVDADELRDLNDAARKRAPLEYLDRVRWYMKGATAGDAE